MGWTEQQIADLKKMWGHGFSASDIARSLGGGLTRNAVIGKAHRLKLSVDTSAMTKVDPTMSRIGGSVMSTITRISKKRAMLRPLPSVQMPETQRPMTRESLSAFDAQRRTEGIAVTKAGERHCRWPIGDPRSPDFRFCGCSCEDGLPYCIDHARVAYQNVSRKARASTFDNIPEYRIQTAAGRQ